MLVTTLVTGHILRGQLKGKRATEECLPHLTPLGLWAGQDSIGPIWGLKVDKELVCVCMCVCGAVLDVSVCVVDGACCLWQKHVLWIYQSGRPTRHRVDWGSVPNALDCYHDRHAWQLRDPSQSTPSTMKHTHTSTICLSDQHFRLIGPATATAGWGLRHVQIQHVCISVCIGVHACVCVYTRHRDRLVPLAPVAQTQSLPS